MSICGICNLGIDTAKVHVCPAMLPQSTWLPWDSPLFRQSPPAELTWRQAWDQEVSRLAPEILRDPVACTLAHIAERAFDEYEARIKRMGEAAE